MKMKGIKVAVLVQLPGTTGLHCVDLTPDQARCVVFMLKDLHDGELKFFGEPIVGENIEVIQKPAVDIGGTP